MPGNSFTNIYVNCAAHIPDIRVEVKEDFLVLKYWYNHYPQEQQIHIEKMPAHYGGARSYLICPDCDSKRTSLYLLEKE